LSLSTKKKSSVWAMCWF